MAGSGATRIERVLAREVLDSRGNPTVEVEVILAGGARGIALVPSGASTGMHEVLELRDGDGRYGGKGVRRAVANAEGPLAKAVTGLDAARPPEVDAALKAADGTPALSALGANAVLGISLAAARAAAAAEDRPFHAFLADAFGDGAPRLPVPMLNVLNGGAHADNGLDVQEIMVAPVGMPDFAEAIRAGAEIYHALQKDLAGRGLSTAVGDEGGFAPRVATNEEAIEIVARSVERAGYDLGREIFMALDVAATEFFREGTYHFENKPREADEMIAQYERWADQYPIYSIEDGLAEDDWAGWERMTQRLGDRLQIVGDDIFVTDPDRVARGIREGVANAVLVKPNQIGSLTDTFRCVRTGYDAGYGVVLSHRSGETEDTTIADLAVAVASGQIKTGAPCRGERTAKYNRLLRIEAELRAAGTPAPYGRVSARGHAGATGTGGPP
ncbi:MAG: phosphopyruvate hydratase [Planctomycetota bacterium]|jgi:enolase